MQIFTINLTLYPKGCNIYLKIVDLMNKIAKQVKDLRKKYKLTQAELAQRSGVGLRFLRELEQGKPTVRLDKVQQVINFFGYHVGVIKDEKHL